jgi:hypothetical protein
MPDHMSEPVSGYDAMRETPKAGSSLFESLSLDVTIRLHVCDEDY